MEISDKNACPHCHTAPDPATGLCRCPASPGASAAALDLPSGRLVAQAELLFETYIAARLVRARRQLKTAKSALLRDARNRACLDELRRAEQETERLQVQLLEQARKAAHAREQHSGGATATPPAPPAPAVARALPTECFRTTQAAKADEAYGAAELGRRSRRDDRNCPRCGDHTPGESGVCACGHEFVASGTGAVAEPFLSEEEIAALRKTVKAP